MPPAATVDLIGVGPLVQAPLAAHFVFEMLDRVGDEDTLALDPGFLKSAGQYAAGRTNEGQTGFVFLVARLLADQHHRRAARPLPGHRLGGVLVERTAPAFVFSRPQRR